MSRERPAFRDNMEMLLEATGGKTLIRLTEAAKVLGINKKTLEATEGLKIVMVGKSRMLSVATLARWLS